MIRFAIFFICMILAVGSIDGPVGHESDNWIGFWILTSSDLKKINQWVFINRGFHISAFIYGSDKIPGPGHWVIDICSLKALRMKASVSMAVRI